MSNKTMPSIKRRSKFRLGCMGYLAIIVAAVIAVYWLLFSPIQGQEQELGSLDSAPAVLIEGNISARQNAALNKMAGESQQNVKVLAQDGEVLYLTMEVLIPDSIALTAKEKAWYFLEQNQNILQITDVSQSLEFEEERIDSLGNTFIRFSQHFRGIPVQSSNIVVGINKEGAIYFINANYSPNLQKVNNRPSILPETAEEIAYANLNINDAFILEKTTLGIFSPGLYSIKTREKKPLLAWYVTIGSDTQMEYWLYIIDADKAGIINKVKITYDMGGEQFNLEIFEAGESDKDYVLVMNEKGDTRNNRIPSEYSKAAFDNARGIYKFYTEEFDRNNYDDKPNSKLIIKVNFQNCIGHESLGKAFWNPVGKFIYFCKDYSKPFDVMSHEFTHAIISSQIVADNKKTKFEEVEFRELNEAFADIFAAFASNDGSPWEINDYNGILRNLQSPQEGYPQKYEDRYCDRRPETKCPTHKQLCPEIISNDKESALCEHINSLVFSHAAYLMSSDADASNGIPRDKLKYLYYYLIMNGQIQPSTQQRQAARAIQTSCISLIGEEEIIPGKPLLSVFSEQDCNHITDVLNDVGLLDPGVVAPPIMPDLRFLSQKWPHFLQDWVRQRINDMLGKWSPVVLWRDIFDYLKNFRENYWGKFFQCLIESDQNCMERYLTDILVSLLEIFGEICISVVSFFCASIGFPISLVFYLYRKQVKSKTM